MILRLSLGLGHIRKRGCPVRRVLCKYSKSPIVSSDADSVPYENASIQITIKNELSDGRSVRRIVFRATAFSL